MGMLALTVQDFGRVDESAPSTTVLNELDRTLLAKALTSLGRPEGAADESNFEKAKRLGSQAGYIGIIRLVRTLTSCGMRDAKIAVDRALETYL